MAKPFSANIFDSIISETGFGKILDGVEENRHFAFEFLPFCGETLFAESISGRLQKRELLVFPINLKMITGQWHFALEFAKALVGAVEEQSQKAAMIKRLTMAGPVRVERDETGNLNFDISSRSDIPRLISSLLDIPEVTGMEENRRSVVIISGFERLAKILGPAIMKMFYQKTGRQAITSYLLTGYGISSDAKKMEGKIKNQVESINTDMLFGPEKVESSISEEFEMAGRSISEETVKKIMEICRGRVELALLLAKNLYNSAGMAGPINQSALTETLSNTLCSASTAFHSLWNLHNARQKSLLFGLSVEEGKSIYSERFITKYGFGTATNLQAALRGLNSKYIVIKEGKKWEFANPFFRLWIRDSIGAK